MARLASLEFEALTPNGSNYLNWKIDASLALRAQDLSGAIVLPNSVTANRKAKALMLLRKHIDPSLKNEYLTVDCPGVLWQQLSDRFHHLELITLPAADNAWRKLRFQDFKTVAEFNSALLSITSKLELCGKPVPDEEKIDKTLSTFHADSLILQQQYRGFKFTTYHELMHVLFKAEEQNNLLLQNHLDRPVGAAPLPEANHNALGSGRGNPPADGGRGRGRGRGSGRGRGRGNNNRGRGRGNGRGGRGGRGNGRGRGRLGPNSANFKPPHDKDICFKCGEHGHWSRTCRATKEEVDAYKKSIENHLVSWAPKAASVPPSCSDTMYPFMNFDDCDDLDDFDAPGNNGLKAST